MNVHQALFTTPWFAVTPASAMEAVFVTLSVIGQEFIVRRDRRGFMFWLVGNVVAVVLFTALGRWMSALLYVYFIVKSIQGSARWRALEVEQASPPNRGEAWHSGSKDADSQRQLYKFP